MTRESGEQLGAEETHDWCQPGFNLLRNWEWRVACRTHASVAMDGFHTHPRHDSILTHNAVIPVLSTTTKEHLVVFGGQRSPKYKGSIPYNPPPLPQ